MPGLKVPFNSSGSRYLDCPSAVCTLCRSATLTCCFGPPQSHAASQASAVHASRTSRLQPWGLALGMAIQMTHASCSAGAARGGLPKPAPRDDACLRVGWVGVWDSAERQ